MSQLFASGGQSIGVSASSSVLPINTQICQISKCGELLDGAHQEGAAGALELLFGEGFGLPAPDFGAEGVDGGGFVLGTAVGVDGEEAGILRGPAPRPRVGEEVLL